MELTDDFINSVSLNYNSNALLEIYKKYLSKVELSIPSHYSFYEQVHSFKTNKYTREYLVKLLTIVLYDKFLFNKLFKLLPIIVQKIFNEVIFDDEPISQQQMSKRLDERVFFNVTNPSSDFGIIMSLFVVKSKFGDYFIELPIPIKSVLKNHIVPYTSLTHKHEPIKSSTLESGLLIYENQGEILDDINNYYFHLTNNDISFDKFERISKTSINLIKKDSGIEEFFPEKDKKIDSLKTELIFNFLIRTKVDTILKSPLQIVQGLFKNYLDYKTKYLSFNLLTYLNFSAAFIRSGGDKVKNNSFNLDMFNILKCLPLEKWVAFDNIFEYAESKKLNLEILSQRDARSLFFISNGVTEYMNTERAFKEGLIRPIMKSSLFLFASFGLIDIAYQEPIIKNMFYPCQTLRYVKLTKLGNFIIGNQKEYLYESKKEECQISLDDDNLIIKFSIQDRIKSILMRKFSEELNQKTFRVTYKTFLSDCRTKKDVIDKIVLFKEQVSSNLNPLWQQFFDELIIKSDLLKENRSMLVFSMTKNDELIKLITRDEILKSYVLKVENFKLAIFQKDLKAVSERLLEFGFLI